MATNFPTSLDNLDPTRGTANDKLSQPSHVTHHTNEDDAIEALQAKVGVNNSAVTSSLDYKLTNASSVSPGHKHVSADISDLLPISSSTGVSDGGKLVKTNFNGLVDKTFTSAIELGNSSDGSVTISSPTTLSRDMYYTNLTVNSTLTTAGYRIYVSGTLSGSGTIDWGTPNNGGNGGNGTGSAGGGGGAGGATSGSGVFTSAAGSAGGAGGRLGVGSNGATSAGANTTPLSSRGGTGGNGSVAGGSAGTQGITFGNQIPTESKYTSGYVVESPLTIASLKKWGGTGGGGGGGYVPGSEGAGGGGGGGASGGIVWIACNTWDGTFTIKSIGGNGGNGGNAFTSFGGVGAGGGGGNGGDAIILYKTKTWSGVYNLAGGTKGAKGSTGTTTNYTEATNGTDGTSYEVKISI